MLVLFTKLKKSLLIISPQATQNCVPSDPKVAAELKSLDLIGVKPATPDNGGGDGDPLGLF